ncbi:MAG: CoA-binding protein [Dehalococcoidia bacterium]|nr:CoA-binding protein [Dehalococcoidia bacterium]
MTGEAEILRKYKTVAVVGLSDDPERPSYRVAAYLKDNGYRIIPVNPKVKWVLGELSYPDLLSIPVPFEIVDIFRRPEDVGPIVEQAIAKGARVIWMQEGITNEEAASRARQAGLQVVMDRCMMKEHRKLSST